jgi:hypothetical protein
MDSNETKSRRGASEITVDLELEALDLRDTIGLTLIFASLCVESCGVVLFYGGTWGHSHGAIGYVGLALLLGGATVFGLTVWLLQPHKAAKHAMHRLRHHARKLSPARREQPQRMTDAEFDAIEDAVDRDATQSQG